MLARADEIELLTGLLSQYSPSERERPAVEYLVGEMERRGFKTHIDDAGNAVGIMGEGAREVLLLGHIDTVSGRIEVRQEGDALYGRGAVDAKGPLSTFVAAATRAGDQITQDRLRIVAVGAVEEEAATSRGARHILTQRDPDYVVIGEPSQWDRITLGYKGRLLLDYLHCREVSHTAGPGASVCEELVDFWQDIRRYVDGYNDGKSRMFATINPSLRRISSDDDGLMEKVEATMGFRLPLELDVEAMKCAFVNLAPPESVITFYAEERPFRADKNTSLSRAFRVAIRDAGGKPAFKVKTGTSDMNVVGPVWNCPIVAYGPGDSDLDHTPNEHIRLQEYGHAIAVLTDVLVTLASE
jgi:LysW-gamma-L-lysine carboxypeptidase